MAARLRAKLPAAVFLYTNEGFRFENPCSADHQCVASGAGPAVCGKAGLCTPAVWASFPAALDYISLDGYASGASEAHFAREQYERYFFPLMRPGQKAWVVPGLYGKDSGGNRTAAAATEDELLAKLDGYLQWASGPDGDRIAGINPWHWPALPGIKPASMELGAASFPRLLAKITMVVAALPPA